MSLNVGEVTDARPAEPPRQRPDRDDLPASTRRMIRFGRLDMKFSPYLLVAPFFVLFAVFGVYPLVWTIVLSTRRYTLTGGDQGFVGWQNYTRLLTDDQFWLVLFNTFGLFIVATVPQLLLALLLASWLNKQLRFRTALRMGVLIPNITSVATVGIVFGFIFADRYGLANWLLQEVGLDAVNWRDSRWASWTAISVMVDWRWTGYNALIYLAAMQAIPKDLYESAALDGASAARRFWRITVPLIQPTILFTVIISTIGAMQLFTEPLLFNYGRIQGGSLNEFQTVAMYIYETVFTSNYNVGRGAAASLILFLIIIVFAVINFALVRRSVRGSES